MAAPPPAARAWLSTLSPRRRFRAWLQARLPLKDSWTLGQRNIYILPTRAGFTFAATLVVMLVASINYQLSLGYALTFLLASSALVSMHLTHANLRGLTLHLRPPAPVHAGAPALLEVVISNPGGQRYALALRHEDDAATTVWTDAPAGGQAVAHLSFVPPRRGWHGLPTLQLETVFPFGLFRAWTVWRPASRLLAWPRPEQPEPPLPASGSSTGDPQPARRGGGSELDGVRPWRRGDTMRQVVWKKVAHSGEMVSRETAGSAARELWLDWQDTTGDAERRLARLAAWVLTADREGITAGLRLPGREQPPGQGAAHRRAALDLLGQWA
ncbi:DUF58 domain-containing protein [Rubrivivax sp. A210]|uniref:DUF58 domain-containing protein n=1 Tax=Rubrivivax sp. A210 TaxID=2772301 RepID=UPI0019181541|nr:DUF58 domain-containing protein [Rubrivivax sp. A210]